MAEPLNSYRKTLHAAIRDQGYSEWQRIPADAPCEICAPLAYEVQPVAVGFRDHPGCRCSLRPYGERLAEQTPAQEVPARVITMSRSVRYV
jgi:hypothetical protein